jgi:hypothetical protein
MNDRRLRGFMRDPPLANSGDYMRHGRGSGKTVELGISSVGATRPSLHLRAKGHRITLLEEAQFWRLVVRGKLPPSLHRRSPS